MTSSVIALLAVIVYFGAAQKTGKDTDKSDFLQSYNAAQRALFFRTDASNLRDNSKKKIFQDISLLENLLNTTEMTTTLTYDENATTPEDGPDVSTDSAEYSTELPNITEVSLFGNNTPTSTTVAPPKRIPSKKSKDEFCPCDLTFDSCDINCCCDEECAESERNIFSHCIDTSTPIDHRYCYSHIFYYKNNTASKIKFETDNLFCILKDNLPRKRNTARYNKITDTKEAENLVREFYKWPEYSRPKMDNKYKATPYSYGDSIWSLNNSEISVIDVPVSYLNDYCHHRNPVKFLKNTKQKCIVKVADLEMFNIYNNFNRTIVAGMPRNISDESDAFTKNCTIIHCIPWVIFVCDENNCELLNKSRHFPSCDDTLCVNIATRIKYVFHCLNSRIKKAEIYLYTINIRVDTPLLQQEIIVKYYLEKENGTENAVDLSGNPGYNMGKPIIISHAIGDTLDIFTNNSFPLRNIISFPKNVDGSCILSNLSYETINFGHNLKNKCSYTYKGQKDESNGTLACNQIQNSLYTFLGLNKTDRILISPLGNPYLITKEDWIDLIYDKPDSDLVRGEYRQNKKVLHCYSFVSVLSYEFTYANVTLSDDFRLNRKVLRSVIHYRDSDVVFDLDEDIVIMVSTNALFFDITKPASFEYARGPHLNIHLPSDFFYPFTSNCGSRSHNLTVFMVVNMLCVVYLYFHL